MQMTNSATIVLIVASITWPHVAFAQDDKPDRKPVLDTARGDRMIASYFRAEADKLAGRVLNEVTSLDDWKRKRIELRKQLFEMLGLDPMPEKTPLRATVTGTVDHEQFTVEKLHYQSRPGLYVTGNLYIPKNRKDDERLPAIIYVCGHSHQKKGDVSYGNKAGYQHHGAWFARNGYVCLTIDSLQLGEIEAIHHGTYRYNMWWWNNRGYSSAAVEAWNCIRALDYLETRPEVDAKRIGVTGRSGGGAYSWWISALDDRIAAAVPVAGITDLINHVADGGAGRYHDGVVEGHCDCMYIVNTYRWDYATVAALVAPRPLLISNSDKDVIFPLDGVYRIHQQVKRIYDMYGAGDKLGLQITEGPHKDTQELRVHAFRWFNRWLTEDDSLIREPAEKLFEVEQLRVFDKLPEDEKNTTIQESFTKTADFSAAPASKDEAKKLINGWSAALRTRCFAGWPAGHEPLDVEKAFDVTRHGIRFTAYDFTSQLHVRLRLYVLYGAKVDEQTTVELEVLDDDGWRRWVAMMRAGFAQQLEGEIAVAADDKAFEQFERLLISANAVWAWVAPRGVGPTAWDQKDFEQTQHRRRFMLVGQTLDGMRVYDIVRSAAALRGIDGLVDARLFLRGRRIMAGNVLYASLFIDDVARADLWHPPRSHRDGPIYLNVRRFLDIPQALGWAATRAKVRIFQDGTDGWDYAAGFAEAAGVGSQLEFLPARGD